MMLHLSRVHDYSTFTSFYPLASISKTIKYFEENLDSPYATICSSGITENLRVVWSTIEDVEITPV
ncbi:hypothetical protein IWQ62_004375 [Dispira parvispora]|uniref:Uncharacterized protein n=1 Tax=Dispira parvispora TaxID=1520584 RepID=A0A9W8ASF9_9FUNG|nr:hypothetical protein IWQ62_004375 [Dispira parvispora]